MEKGKIIINENGVKIIPADGNIWLSEWQIAKLFDVFVAKVSSNIVAICILTISAIVAPVVIVNSFKDDIQDIYRFGANLM